ncbi:hypothetical protein RF11_11136 [Thelohanellus kitauei]|uniref:Uncharacterized protein n=1 Tax=Thelohanellus kitauei TaxID=669202 RepID=A0A0C2MMD1_THEKT|nr:hypothetical protein RF11_11136 [Thelohanellus kitauei]
MIIDNFIIPQTEFSWLKSDKLASLNVVHRKSDLEKLKEASVNLIHLTSELLNSKDKSFNNEHLINQNVDEMFDSMTFYSNIDQPRRHEGRRYSNIHSDELLGHTLHMFTKAGGSHFRPSGPVLNF